MTAKGTLPAPLPMDQRRRARELWESGESYGTIESQLDVKVSTLKSWRARDKWTRTKPSSDELAVIPTEIVEDVPDLPTLAEKQEFFQEKTSDAAVKLAAHMGSLDGPQLVQHADKLLKATQTARKSLKLDTERPACVIQLGVLCAPVRPARRDDGRLRSTHHSAKLVEADPETVLLDPPDSDAR